MKMIIRLMVVLLSVGVMFCVTDSAFGLGPQPEPPDNQMPGSSNMMEPIDKQTNTGVQGSFPGSETMINPQPEPPMMQQQIQIEDEKMVDPDDDGNMFPGAKKTLKPGKIESGFPGSEEVNDEEDQPIQK